MKMYYCAVENNLHAYITIIKSNAENNWEKHSGFSYPQ